MSPDDIDTLALKIHDFILVYPDDIMNEDHGFNALLDYMHTVMDKFVTKDRNYN